MVGASVRHGKLAGRGRVGLHPALAGDPRLDPGVGVAVAHDVEPAALVGVRPHAQALDEAGRHSLEAEEDDGRAREVLAVSGLLLEQELGERVSRAEGPRGAACSGSPPAGARRWRPGARAGGRRVPDGGPGPAASRRRRRAARGSRCGRRRRAMARAGRALRRAARRRGEPASRPGAGCSRSGPPRERARRPSRPSRGAAGGGASVPRPAG